MTLDLTKVIGIVDRSLWLPISGLQRLYLAPFPRYYHFYKVRDCHVTLKILQFR